MSIYDDLIAIVSSHPGITSAETLDHLESLGYYRNKPEDMAVHDISKKLNHLKKTNKVTATQFKGKSGTENRWTALLPIVEPEEMASDIAEVNHAEVQPNPETIGSDASRIAASEAVSTEIAEALPDPSAHNAIDGIQVPVDDDAKKAADATHKEYLMVANMPVTVALGEYGSYSWKEGISLCEVFMAGIACAEEYHKIGLNEN